MIALEKNGCFRNKTKTSIVAVDQYKKRPLLRSTRKEYKSMQIYNSLSTLHVATMFPLVYSFIYDKIYIYIQGVWSMNYSVTMLTVNSKRCSYVKWNSQLVNSDRIGLMQREFSLYDFWRQHDAVNKMLCIDRKRGIKISMYTEGLSHWKET